MRSRITGAGHYLPTRVVTNDDLSKRLPTIDEWIQQRTGIKERRYIEHSGIGASDLAVPASKMALAQAGLEPKDVQAIVFATLSPDVNFPGSACFLQQKLGCGQIPSLDVRNQCSGFLYSLSIADAWIRAGVYQNVLIVGAEVHSTGIDFSEHGRDVTVLFGDGAGAVVLQPTEHPTQGVRSVHLAADGVGAKELWLEAPASMYDPRLTVEMMEQRRHWPKMNGKQVFRWAVDKMPEIARAALSAQGMSPSDVDLFVPHQANMRINQAVAEKLGIPHDRVVHNIERYGNTTAATIPIGISESWKDGKIAEGSRVLMAAFGAGFTWGSAIVEF
ncbi:MAG: ketoacyl-ACP synthase III [Myxococcales bacterium]|nr:ketoacyl-ACP synthase III [Myxococcales bacterium]